MLLPLPVPARPLSLFRGRGFVVLHVAVLLVVQQAPAAVDRLDTAAVVVVGAAERIRAKEAVECDLTLLDRDVGAARKAGDAGPDAPEAVGHCQHRDPRDARGGWLAPHRALGDGGK